MKPGWPLDLQLVRCPQPEALDPKQNRLIYVLLPGGRNFGQKHAKFKWRLIKGHKENMLCAGEPASHIKLINNTKAFQKIYYRSSDWGPELWESEYLKVARKISEQRNH
jgi:hypothetical protein